MVSALIEAAGLALSYLAAGRVSAVARAVLTGFGHSLVYSSGKRGRSTLHRLYGTDILGKQARDLQKKSDIECPTEANCSGARS